MTHEIRTLADGEKITEPGFYNIPLEVHHSQCCDGVSVTSGVLRRMELHGPSKVWAYHDLNPDRYEEARGDALRLGSAMAAIVEGGIEELHKAYLVLDANKPDRPSQRDFQALKEGRATSGARNRITFWADVERDPRDHITEAEFELLVAMGEALAKDPSAGAVLGGLPEITMAAFDERTQLWFLARPDNVNFDGTLSDYKKVNTGGNAFSGWFVDRRVEAHGYDMQMGFAADVFERLTGVWTNECGLVFQEDAPPYDVILRPIPEEDLRIGQFLNNQSALRFRECLDAEHWPGPGEHIGAFLRRKEAREALLERMNTAGEAP